MLCDLATAEAIGMSVRMLARLPSFFEEVEPSPDRIFEWLVEEE